MRAHEVHAHEAYAPETDDHCAVFAIRHLLPHRSTFSPTSRAPVASHENLLSTTSTCCLLRELVAYEHLAASCENILPIPTSSISRPVRRNTCVKDTLGNGFKFHRLEAGNGVLYEEDR
jgi:hypothetical protein